jgi:hypothetical protein
MTSFNKRRLLTLLSLLGVVVVGLELNGRLLTRLWRQSQVSPQNEKQEAAIPQGFVRYPWYKWEPHSVAELPAEIQKTAGGICLQVGGYGEDSASQEMRRAGTVPVYLINDSDDDLKVPSQDGDIYLRLEAKLDDGRWCRVQFHQNSDCGNSYISHELPAHHFVRVSGYNPSSGRRAKVRYVIHNRADDPLVSEEFEGSYSTDDLALSEFDAMSLSEAGLPALRAFLLREEQPKILHYDQRIEDLRQTAWYSLISGKHELLQTLKIAKEVHVSDPTLHRIPLDLEKMITSRHASRGKEDAGVKRIHGFYVDDKLPENHAK